MAYTRAVWIEDDHEQPFSGTVPSNWIIKPFVFWPPSSKAAVAFKKRENPNIKTWSKFQLLKTKLQTDNFNEAEAVADTSAAEHDESTTENQSKRSHKPTCSEGFVRTEDFGSDTESENEPQTKKFRHESDNESSKYIKLSRTKLLCMSSALKFLCQLQVFHCLPKKNQFIKASHLSVSKHVGPKLSYKI